MDRNITNKPVTAKEAGCRTIVSGARRGTGTARGRTQRRRFSDDQFLAASVGNCEWLDSTLQLKCTKVSDGNPVHFDENGMAPIHLAAANGHPSALELLVEKYGVDVNLASQSGLRPLHLCVNQKNGDNSYQCLLFLLKKDATPSVVDNEGNTPLHHAASEGNVKCVKELIRAGASVLSINKLGQRPFNLAQLKGHQAAANLLRDSEWHERSKVASQEAQHLKKLRMTRAISEIQQYSKLQDLCIKYNEQAFDKWLEKHKIDRRVQLVADCHKNDSNFHQRANSSRIPNGNETKVYESRKRAVLSGKKHSRNYQRVKESAVEKPVKTQNSTSAMFSNSDAITAWKPSFKAAEVDYIPHLRDHYPRDPYTFLPQFSTRRRTDAPSVMLAKEELKQLGVNRISEVEDMTYAELKSLTDSLNLSENSPCSVVFGCKNIVDVTKRRHYDADTLAKPEISLHLINDIHSSLFQRGLYSGAMSRLTQTTPQTYPFTCPLQEKYSDSNLVKKLTTIGNDARNVSQLSNIHLCLPIY